MLLVVLLSCSQLVPTAVKLAMACAASLCAKESPSKVILASVTPAFLSFWPAQWPGHIECMLQLMA